MEVKKQKQPMQLKSILSKRSDILLRRIRFSGTEPIMFDRYSGDNSTELKQWQKLYLMPGTNEICLPAANLMSALTAQNTPSFVKRLRPAKQYKQISNDILSFTRIIGCSENPSLIKLLRGNKPIILGNVGANDKMCPDSGCYIQHDIARLDKGIPNPKARPVLPLPWEIEFEIRIDTHETNKFANETEIANLLVDGGKVVGLGTYRGRYGKFDVIAWDVIDG